MTNLGKDFEELKLKAREIPEVKEYLESFGVIIGNIVLARRINMNLTQAELAKLAGTTQARISQIESAVGNIRQDVLDRVFRELKLQKIEAHFSDEQAAAQA